MGKGLVSWITTVAAVGAFSELTSFGSSVQANCVFDCLRDRHLGGEWGGRSDACQLGCCGFEAKILQMTLYL